MRLNNNTNIPLSIAVWLAEDTYDKNDDHVSATQLLKSTRQLILSSRTEAEDIPVDVSAYIASSMGTAFHDAIRHAWENNYEDSLEKLGYPSKAIERVKINPDPEEVTDEDIPIYIERRSTRNIDGFTISGEFDFVAEGKLEDFKSTSVFVYMSKTNDWSYRMQGSIYRWLNPGIITHDTITIRYIFTDWSKLRSIIEKGKGYPRSKIESITLDLLSLEETEQFIKDKLAEIKKYENAPEAELPRCTPYELWQSPSVFKYYKNPNNTKRSTANFDDYYAAKLRCDKDGNVGIVKEVPGQVKACLYCNAYPICTQKDGYLTDGTLVI